MAVDKLVDSAQLNADLTSVANAIRTKGGTSASLAFPADFVSAIGDIPTGGGGGEWQVKTGTYTPTTDYTTDGLRQITSVDSLGFTPTGFLFAVTDRSTVSGIQYAMIGAWYFNTGETSCRSAIRYSTTSNTSNSNVASAEAWTTSSASLLVKSGDNICYRTSGGYNLIADVEYTWVAFAPAE